MSLPGAGAVGGLGASAVLAWVRGGGPRLPWTCGFFSIAADFLPTFMYCLGSRDFEVVQTALRNLPEYTLLCQGPSAAPGGLGPPAQSESGRGAGAELTGPRLSAEHAAVLLHRAFLVGMYGQMDTSAQISEALRILHLEAVM